MINGKEGQNMYAENDLEQNIELSIIVPVYNVEKYIAECLESIVLQKTENMEIILVNDGSTDASKEICEMFCYENKNIFLYNQSNQGVSAARNKGIELARGRYLIFLDSDDWLIKDIIPEFLECLYECEVDLIVSKHDTYLERMLKYKKSTEDFSKVFMIDSPTEVLQMLNYQNPFWITVTSVCVKREMLLNNKLYFKTGIRHEDELWIHQVFFAGQSVKLFDKSLFCYRFGRDCSFNITKDIQKEFDRMLVINELGKLEQALDDKNSCLILRERKAVLIWTVMRELEEYRNDIRFQELFNNVKDRIICLKSGRHVRKYLMCKMIGIKGTCWLANIMDLFH